MNTVYLVLLTIAALAYLLFRLFSAKKKSRALDEFEDLNEKFMRNPGKKMGTVDLAKVSQPDALTLLRSLLDAEGIESYVIESRFGGLYPLSNIPGFTEVTVTIFQSDRDAARQLVTDYLASEPAGEPRVQLLD